MMNNYIRISGDGPYVTMRAIIRGSLAAAASFGILGTVSALWENPLFIRMTPTSGFEITLLAVQSVLIGFYMAIPRSSCSVKTAGVGSILNFLGIACPICNKLLVFMFGSQLLLTYFEPVRLYVGMLGIALTTFALVRKLRHPAVLPIQQSEA